MVVQLDELLSKASSLPPIPKIMQELLGSLDQSDANLTAVGKKIAMDQSLGTSVLRMANSAAYRGRNQITSVADAVIRLGMKRIRSIVVAAGLKRMLPGSIDPKVFWLEAFRVANLAKLMAQHAKSEPETAFTCAMLHNLGELMIAVELPEDAGIIELLMEQGKTRVEAQRQQLGFDYSQVGARLAQRWNFSSVIVEAIAQHIDLKEEDPSIEAALIRMSLFSLHSLDAEVPASVICQHLPRNLVTITKLNSDAIAPLLVDAAAEGESLVKSMFAVRS